MPAWFEEETEVEHDPWSAPPAPTQAHGPPGQPPTPAAPASGKGGGLLGDLWDLFKGYVHGQERDEAIREERQRNIELEQSGDPEQQLELCMSLAKGSDGMDACMQQYGDLEEQ